MTNNQRGELVLTADGQTYTLALDINALCLLEDKYSTPDHRVSFTELLDSMGGDQPSIRVLRDVVWASLQTHHPGTTVEEAGRLMQACGGLAGFATQLGVLVGSTVPDASDVAELGGADEKARRPPVAQVERKPRGTGARSISMPARSA